ncbi:MAG: hypothetical protein HC896_09820, partial [Bacteroidales bacterium]|nr:hypothetical protein [Bacteroidales bacterium]
MANFINAFDVNQAPYLSSNLGFENVPDMQALVDAGRVKHSTVVTKGGEQIGIVGLTTPLIDIISSPGATTISDAIVDSVQYEVNKLTAAGVNKIILISHLQDYNEDIDLVSQISGVDIVIAGGGDEFLTNDPSIGAPYNIPAVDVYPVVAKDKDSNNVYLVTTPGGYRLLGNLLVDFNTAGEVTRVYQSNPVLVTGTPNADLVAQIEQPIRDYIGDLAINVIAVAEDTLEFRREYLRNQETNGGNLFADALLWQARKEHANFGVNYPDIAIQNGGGLRLENLIEPGDFTEDLTYKIAAFTNIVSVVEDIAPAKLLELMEHGIAKAPALDGRFPHIAGFVLVYDPTRPEGDKVISITLDNGTPIVANGEVVAGAPNVNMATIDFTANGGDGYPFAPYGPITLGATYQQAFSSYLQAADGLNGVISAAQYPFQSPKQRIIAAVSETPALSPVALSEDFNNCPAAPAGWLAYSVSSNHDWICTNFGASNQAGDYGYEMNGYGADVVSEDWLISPALSLGNGGYVLNFNSNKRYAGPALQVLYSTNYSGTGNPNAATWTVQAAATAAVDVVESSNNYVNSGDISLDGITGNVYFAFKYVSTGTGSGTGARYRVDDVVIKSNTLLYEDFNANCAVADIEPEGWNIEEIGTPGIVTCSSQGFVNDPNDYSLQCNGYRVGAGEVWIISPKVALGEAGYILNFASRSQYDGPAPMVLYSTNYSGIGNPNNATWTNLPDATNAIGGSFSLSPDIDLSFIGA